MNQNVHIVAKLLIIFGWNSQSQENEEMSFLRYGFKNALGYCEYSRICYVVSKLPELIPNMLNDGVKFTLSTSQIKIGCRETHMTSFENIPIKYRETLIRITKIQREIFRMKYWYKWYFISYLSVKFYLCVDINKCKDIWFIFVKNLTKDIISILW